MKLFNQSFLAFIFLNSPLAFAHHGIMQDSRSNIYYSDLHYVQKVTPNGRKQVAAPHVHPIEIATGPARLITSF